MSRLETIAARLKDRQCWRTGMKAAAYAGVFAMVVLSAIVTKEARHGGRLGVLAEVNEGVETRPVSVELAGPAVSEASTEVTSDLASSGDAAVEQGEPSEDGVARWPAETRWFNGRPVRPAKTVYFTVTAYSPDERSCGPFADGQTASLHSVWTNNMKLVAADSAILPLGSMISVPGYDDGEIVPVLDRGGAIKGYRLDVLYPTHEIARQWGVQRLPITIWEYADDLPPDDFRAIRDSRN